MKGKAKQGKGEMLHSCPCRPPEASPGNCSQRRQASHLAQRVVRAPTRASSAGCPLTHPMCPRARGKGAAHWALGARGPWWAPAQLFLQVQHVAVALRIVSCLRLHELVEAAEVVHLWGGGQG